MLLKSMGRAFGLVILATSVASSQESTATIWGFVTDSSGALVPRARIVVTSSDTGVSKETQSGRDGSYEVPYLLVGHYQVQFTSAGFKELRREGVEVGAGQ